MTDTPLQSAADNVVSGSTQTPGEQLCRAREVSGLNLAQVADQLRLSEEYITAIENDAYEKLPAEPFVLGYLRAYSKLVNLSPESLVENYHRYRQQMESTVEQLIKPEVPEITSKRSRAVKANLPYVSVALVLLWVVLWMLFSGGTEEPSAESIEVEEAPAAIVEKSVSEVMEEVQAAAEEMAPASITLRDSQRESLATDENNPFRITELAGNESQASETVVSETVISEALNSEAGASAVSNAVAGDALALDILEVVFNGDCWLEIKDASGKRITADLYRDGQVEQFQGVAPFEVLLGNAAMASVTLNGLAVDTQPRPGRKTLRTIIDSQ